MVNKFVTDKAIAIQTERIKNVGMGRGRKGIGIASRE